MTLVALPTPNLGLNPIQAGMAPAIANLATLNQAADKFVVIGMMEWADGDTHSVRTISTNIYVDVRGTTKLKFAFQTLTGGPPAAPDGTDDENATVDAGYPADDSAGWVASANLSADKSVAHGEMVAVVITINNFGGSPIYIPKGLAGMQVSNGGFQAYSRFDDNGGGYGSASMAAPNLLFTAADGVLGRLAGGAITNGTGSATFNTGGNTRGGMIYRRPYKRKLAGVIVVCDIASGADVTAKLFDTDGTTLLKSNAITAASLRAVASAGWFPFMFPVSAELTENVNYRLVLESTTANNVTLYYDDFSSSAHFPLGRAPAFAAESWTSYNGSVWAETATRRPIMIPMEVQLHDGAAGGTVGGPLLGTGRILLG